MSARWSFIGHPLRGDLPERWPERIPVREIDAPHSYVERARTAEQVPVPTLPRCKCSHGASTHTGGYGQCWIAVCACDLYRDPKEQDQ